LTVGFGGRGRTEALLEIGEQFREEAAMLAGFSEPL
jgi:hypothetical protein